MRGNPFYVEPLGGMGPQIGQNLAGLGQILAEKREQEQAQEKRRQMMEQAQEVYSRGDPDEIAKFSIANPEIGQRIGESIKFKSDATRQNMVEGMRNIITGADPEQVLTQRIQKVQAEGGDASDTMRDLERYRQNPDGYVDRVKQSYAMMDPQGYTAYRKATGQDASDVIPPSNVREWEYYNSLPEGQQRRYLAMKRSGQTFRQNDVTMSVDPTTGTTATPITEAGAAPTTQADQQATLTEQQAVQAAEKEAATQSIKTSKEAFDRIRPIKSAISNVDEAIRLIDEGANTGVVASKLPSVQEASIALDNLQGRLGLDIIGNTTFGALSEAELKFALDTALPKNLEGPALKKWLQRKQRSQKRLAEYLEDAAIFMGKPGNTIADFVERQRAQGPESKGSASDKPVSEMTDEELIKQAFGGGQ